MNVCCCQFDVVWEHPLANLAKIEALLAAAPPPAGALVVLPEMCLSGFTMNPASAAQAPGGGSEQRLAALARQYSVHVLAGLIVTGADGRYYNQSLTFGSDGREIARYSKIHPFTLGGETATYGAGRQVVTFRSGDARVAPFICYDLRFPEIFRQAAWHRPHVFVVIASWPEARIGHWVKLLQARAIENQAYVVGVNRIGRDPKLNHTGRSMIVNHHGEILADADSRECVITADLDLVALAEYRKALPFLDDMREAEVPRTL